MAYQYTRIFPIVKEQSLLYDESETVKERGNGNDRHIPIGRTANGSKYRGLLKFAADWSGMYQIVSARLVVKSTSEVHVTFGAGPTFEVQRVSEYWSEGGGSEGRWATSGGTVYPGPAVTDTTYTKGPMAATHDDVKTLTITDIIEEWAPAEVLRSGGAAGGAQENHGLRLKAPDEATEADRFELYGMRAGNVGERPYIEVTYTANRPPNAPIVYSPVPGSSPAVCASYYASTFDVDYLFSDTDGGYPSFHQLEVYADAATDGTPGTLYALAAGWSPLAIGYGAYRMSVYNITHGYLPPRTNLRYRIAIMDDQGDWGPFTSLADGRFYLAYTVQAPAQSYMSPLTDGAHIYGSLSSADPDDYIKAWEGEFYRDTPYGSVTLWAPGQVGIGGTSTRSDIAYQGDSLVNGEWVRWRQRHANRDDVWGAWTPWQYTQVWASVGPDSLSPNSTNTKLLTREPALTISHGSNFDGYRWRLHRAGEEVYDSGEVAMTAGASVVVYPPAGVLAWGDGGDEAPLLWDAQIRTVAAGVFGAWSPRYAIRINALPGATAEIIPAPSEGVVKVNDVRIWSPYVNADQQAYSEWPICKEVELRETAAGTLPPAGGGALVERRYSYAATGWAVSDWHATGERLHALATSTGWTPDTNVSVSTVADQPSGYTGNSTSIVAASSSTDRGAYYAFTAPISLRDYGTGARLKLWRKVTNKTNLTRWLVRFHSATGDHWDYEVFPSAATINVWAEVDVALQAPTATAGTLVPSAIIGFSLFADVSGTYAGSLYVRDLRVGVIDPDSSTSGPLVSGTSYDWRVRYLDDVTPILVTTLAASSIAGATNVKVASVAGLAAGDSFCMGAASGADWEVREITNVGTAGAGGTGLTLNEGLTYAHTSGDVAQADHWGGWSGWVTATFRPPPTTSLSSPADAGTVNDPTQTLAWSLSGGSGTQSAALVKLYKRVSGHDKLVWQGSVAGTTASLTLPTLLLEHAVTYAWEVIGTDTWGGSTTSSRWTFTTSFTAPAVLAGLAWTIDSGESAVRLTWTASADTYFDHYRVWWLSADGTWQRVDAGPVAVDDGRTKLTTAAFVHYGGRWGANDYRIEAHNGAQASEGAYVTATLTSARDGWWQVVCPTDQAYTRLLRITRADRGQTSITERHDPPGRGSTVHISWGRGPFTVRAETRLRPSEDGDVASRLARLMHLGYGCWLKSPPGWGWDPVYCILTDVQERPQTGGMLDLGLTFERTDDA